MSNSNALWIGVGAVGAVMVGALSWQVLGEASADDGATRQASAQLRLAVDGLGRQMAVLAGQIQNAGIGRGPESAGGATLIPLDAVSGDLLLRLQALQASVDDLADVVEQLGRSVQEERPRYAPRRFAGRPVPDDVFRTLAELPDWQRDMLHFNWTFDDVLDHYGPPDEVEPGGGASTGWHYQRPFTEPIFFSFFDGRVMSVTVF